MIDLFVYFTQEYDLNFNNKELHNRIYNSKRSGFSELKGTLRISAESGKKLILIDNKIKNKKKGLIIYTDRELIEINENKKYVKRNNIKSSISIPFQSQITGDVVDQILQYSNSDLVSYEECIKYHIPMIESFNDHFSKILKKEIVKCPIT